MTANEPFVVDLKQSNPSSLCTELLVTKSGVRRAGTCLPQFRIIPVWNLATRPSEMSPAIVPNPLMRWSLSG